MKKTKKQPTPLVLEQSVKVYKILNQLFLLEQQIAKQAKSIQLGLYLELTDITSKLLEEHCQSNYHQKLVPDIIISQLHSRLLLLSINLHLNTYTIKPCIITLLEQIIIQVKSIDTIEPPPADSW